MHTPAHTCVAVANPYLNPILARIGLRFAMMQMKAGLATVLHKFRVSPVPGINDYPARFELATFVTKVAGGNKVLLHPLV